MVTIIVDTELMTEVASKAKIANNGVADALELLNKVALHYDWECNEKKAINEFTINNKNKINKLHEKTERYLSAVVDAATEYKQSEFDICNSLGDLNNVIGNTIKELVAVKEKGSNGWSKIHEILRKTVADINFKSLFANYETGSIGDSIRVVQFDKLFPEK